LPLARKAQREEVSEMRESMEGIGGVGDFPRRKPTDRVEQGPKDHRPSVAKLFQPRAALMVA
jgi:hypothetical protein